MAARSLGVNVPVWSANVPDEKPDILMEDNGVPKTDTNVPKEDTDGPAESIWTSENTGTFDGLDERSSDRSVSETSFDILTEGYPLGPFHKPLDIRPKRKPTGLSVRTVADPPDPDMGGSAFKSEPYRLDTPRMPPAIYHRVKAACHARLRELYLFVATPIEGAGKEDYGDVDIVVALERQAILPSASKPQLPHPRGGPEVLEMIATALGSEHVIYQPNLNGANMAIPWPEEEAPILSGDSLVAEPPRRRYIQVDIHVSSSVECAQWWLFRHSHGDFWQIVGSILRPFWLVVDEQGLWMRIPEMESFNRKCAKILLSNDPADVLGFLGLKGSYPEQGTGVPPPGHGGENAGPGSGSAPADDGDQFPSNVWDRPFARPEDFFDYVTSCRWFWLKPEEAPDADLSLLRRRRKRQRPLYRQWAEKYIPSLWDSVWHHTFRNAPFNDLSPDGKAHAVRKAIRERWPEAWAIYEERLREFHRRFVIEKQKRKVMEIIHTVASKMPGQDASRALTISAFREVLLEGDYRLVNILPQIPRPDETGMYDLDEVRIYVKEKWNLVADKAWMDRSS